MNKDRNAGNAKGRAAGSARHLLEEYRALPAGEQREFLALLGLERPLPAGSTAEWITRADAARLLRQTAGNVSRHVQRGHLVTNGQEGRALRVRRDSVLEMAARKKLHTKVHRPPPKIIKELVPAAPQQPPPPPIILVAKDVMDAFLGGTLFKDEYPVVTSLEELQKHL